MRYRIDIVRNGTLVRKESGFSMLADVFSVLTLRMAEHAEPQTEIEVYQDGIVFLVLERVPVSARRDDSEPARWEVRASMPWERAGDPIDRLERELERVNVSSFGIVHSPTGWHCTSSAGEVQAGTRGSGPNLVLALSDFIRNVRRRWHTRS